MQACTHTCKSAGTRVYESYVDTYIRLCKHVNVLKEADSRLGTITDNQRPTRQFSWGKERLSPQETRGSCGRGHRCLPRHALILLLSESAHLTGSLLAGVGVSGGSLGTDLCSGPLTHHTAYIALWVGLEDPFLRPDLALRTSLHPALPPLPPKDTGPTKQQEPFVWAPSAVGPSSPTSQASLHWCIYPQPCCFKSGNRTLLELGPFLSLALLQYMNKGLIVTLSLACYFNWPSRELAPPPQIGAASRGSKPSALWKAELRGRSESGGTAGWGGGGRCRAISRGPARAESAAATRALPGARVTCRWAFSLGGQRFFPSDLDPLARTPAGQSS